MKTQNSNNWNRDSLTQPERRGRFNIRRVIVAFLWFLGVVFALAVLIIGLLALPSVRDRIITTASARFRHLDGSELTMTSVRWPAINTIEAAGLRWSSGSDTLAAADSLLLSVDLWRLFHRDLAVNRLRATALKLDYPALMSHTAKDQSVQFSQRRTPKRKTTGFLRHGVMVGWPSVSVRSFQISASSIFVKPDLTINDLTAEGSFSLLNNLTPSFHLHHLAANAPAIETRLEDFQLNLDGENWEIDGQGSARLGDYWPLQVSVRSFSDRTCDLLIRHGEKGAVESAVAETLLALQGRLIPCDAPICSLTCTGVLRVPGVEQLKTIPLLADRLARWPDLEGLSAQLTANLQLQPIQAGELAVVLRPNTWLTHGQAAVRYEERDVWLDTLLVRALDLKLDSRGGIEKNRLTVAARLTADGVRWLTLFNSVSAGVDSLFADLSVRGTGRLDSLAVKADLIASAILGGTRIDSLRVQAEIPAAHDSVATARLQVGALNHRLSTQANWLPGDTLRLNLFPLRIERIPIGDDTAHNRHGAGTVDYVPAQRTVEIKDVSLTGDYGDLSINATLSASHLFSAQVRGVWPNPPIGLHELLRADSVQWNSLNANWRTDGPFSINVQAHGNVAGAPRQGDVDPVPEVHLVGALVLPGPRTFQNWFPATSDLSELSPLQGKFTVASVAQRLTMDLDLSETAWLDTAGVIVEAIDQQLTLKSLLFFCPGLRITAAGARTGDQWDLDANLQLPTKTLLQQIGAISDSTSEINLFAQAGLRGSLSQLTMTGSAWGSWHSSSLTVPRISVAGEWTPEGGGFELRAPEGASVRKVQLDSLRASYHLARSSDQKSEGELSVAVYGSRFSWLQHAWLDRGNPFVLRTDALRLTAGDRDLNNMYPFTIQIDRDPPQIAVDDLELSGSLGSVRIDGWLKPTDGNLSAQIALLLPPQPPMSGIDPDLWPRFCSLELTALGGDRISAMVNLEGLRYAGREITTVQIEGGAENEYVIGHAAAADDVGPILDFDVRLPARIDFYPFRFEYRDGPLSGNLILTRFPAPLPTGEGKYSGRLDRFAEFDANLILTGSTETPFAHARGVVRAPQQSKLSRYALDFDLLQAASAELPPEIIRRRQSSQLDLSREVPPSGGLMAAIALTASDVIRATRSAIPVDIDDPLSEMIDHEPARRPVDETGPLARRQLLSAALRLPLTCTVNPPTAAVNQGGELFFRLESLDLPLSEFDPLLPGNMGLTGRMNFRLGATGSVADPILTGDLEAHPLRLAMADGTNLTTAALLRVSGSRHQPSLNGRIEVARGLIIIPEPTKNLLPAEGKAILWESPIAADSDSMSQPGGTGPPSSPGGLPNQSASLAPNASIEVGVEIPSGLWLRGRGLEVELAGELRGVQKEGTPTLTGELRAVRGHLVFLGRVFQVETGRATFYGDHEINPSLEIVLATRIDGTEIRIVFEGTTLKPQMRFSSEPEMEEGDIIACLLFGRKLSELDNDQMNLLQRRAMEVAASYGTAQLEARLSRQLGVDLVTIRRAGSGNGPTALIADKYLSRRALLRYAQALEGPAAFYLTFEYYLNRHLKIESTAGSRSQSGIEINWESEY